MLSSLASHHGHSPALALLSHGCDVTAHCQGHSFSGELKEEAPAPALQCAFKPSAKPGACAP